MPNLGEYLAISGNIFDCHDSGWDVTDTWWVEPKDAAEALTMHTAAPPKQKLPSPKC